MIAKFPIEDPVAKYLAQMYGFYRTEAECYRKAATVGLGVPTPAVYLSEVSDDDIGTLILMEDLGDARMADQVAGADLADAQAVIDVGAQLHATWWESPHLAELTWLRPLNNPAYMARRGSVHAVVAGVRRDVRSRRRRRRSRSANGSAHNFRRSYDWVMANRPTTLAHTDFRLDNFFFGRAGRAGDRHRLAAQLSGRSAPATSATSSSRASPPRCDASTARRCCEGGIRASSTVVSRDYSWDDAQADFHNSVMVQLSIPVISAANLDPANDRGKQLLDCLATRNFRHWSTTAAPACRTG